MQKEFIVIIISSIVLLYVYTLPYLPFSRKMLWLKPIFGGPRAHIHIKSFCIA